MTLENYMQENKLSVSKFRLAAKCGLNTVRSALKFKKTSSSLLKAWCDENNIELEWISYPEMLKIVPRKEREGKKPLSEINHAADVVKEAKLISPQMQHLITTRVGKVSVENGRYAIFEREAKQLNFSAKIVQETFYRRIYSFEPAS